MRAVRLIARFEVRPEGETPTGEPWVRGLRFAKTFTEGLLGSATTLFWHSGEEGRRSYVAVERISARTEDGREGVVIVHHAGTEVDADTAYGVVLAGEGDFAGWTGRARLRHDERGAFFEFDLDDAG